MSEGVREEEETQNKQLNLHKFGNGAKKKITQVSVENDK
jgi:hypothetical protein